jgi:hypothetical protein
MERGQYPYLQQGRRGNRRLHRHGLMAAHAQNAGPIPLKEFVQPFDPENRLRFKSAKNP